MRRIAGLHEQGAIPPGMIGEDLVGDARPFDRPGTHPCRFPRLRQRRKKGMGRPRRRRYGHALDTAREIRMGARHQRGSEAQGGRRLRRPCRGDSKDKWAQEKQALGEWLSVRAYDASDLEQWLEQSIPAQGWMAEQMGSTDAGAHSLDEQWHRWASVTDPELPGELFAPSVERYKEKLKLWLRKETPPPPLWWARARIQG